MNETEIVIAYTHKINGKDYVELKDYETLLKLYEQAKDSLHTVNKEAVEMQENLEKLKKLVEEKLHV